MHGKWRAQNRRYWKACCRNQRRAQWDRKMLHRWAPHDPPTESESFLFVKGFYMFFFERSKTLVKTLQVMDNNQFLYLKKKIIENTLLIFFFFDKKMVFKDIWVKQRTQHSRKGEVSVEFQCKTQHSTISKVGRRSYPTMHGVRLLYPVEIFFKLQKSSVRKQIGGRAKLIYHHHFTKKHNDSTS